MHYIQGPDDTKSELDEEAEGYAYKIIYGELMPKIIMHQTSGKFCQTAFFLKDTNIADNRYEYAGSYLCQQGDEWHVKKICMNTGKKMTSNGGEVFENLSLGIEFLGQEEARLKKEGYQEIISEQALGHSHYKSFLKERGAIMHKGILNTPAKRQNHVVENGVFLMDDFNHRSVPIKIEEHITALLETMIDRVITNKFSSIDENLPEPLTPLYKEYLNACGDIVSLMQELRYRQKYINLLQQSAGNIEGVHKHLTKPWEKPVLHGHLNRFYMEAEFESLQMHTECDWSKIPSVREVLYKRITMLRNLYSEERDARKSYLEVVKKATPIKPPPFEIVMM